jgi:apolipoprotein N-acyltransferase
LTTSALDGEVQGRSGDTPFIRWGNAPALAAAALMFAAALLWRQRAVNP